MNPIETYLAMATVQRFEERRVALEQEGVIEGSMHFCRGQEAIPIAACRALEAKDAARRVVAL